MRSDVPLESATVPLPDHDPLKPVNGPDWAWLTDTDNMSAALPPAALIACPNNLEPNNFISNFPIQMTFLCTPGFPRYLANGLGYSWFSWIPARQTCNSDSSLAVIGTNAKCRVDRAMSEFGGKAEDMRSTQSGP